MLQYSLKFIGKLSVSAALNFFFYYHYIRWTIFLYAEHHRSYIVHGSVY